MIIEQLIPFLPEHPLLQSLSIVGILGIVSMAAYWVTKKVIISLLTRMVKKTQTQLDDILVNRNIFNRLSYMVPTLIFYNFAYAAPQFTAFIQRASLTLIAIAGLLVINSFINVPEIFLISSFLLFFSSFSSIISISQFVKIEANLTF